MSQNALSIICNVIGHNWMYKDYSNWMKDNGETYPFKASRYCTRCNQIGYLYNHWETVAKKSPDDLERDYFACKKISIDDVIYK
jgi:hypothetical protein